MQLKKFIEETALEAGEILLSYLNKPYVIQVKKGAGIVTEADKASENYVIKKIKKHFPKSSFIAEESGTSTDTGELCWILDPLDGTTNFAHRFPWFCVSLAVYEGKTPLAGVIYQPTTKELFVAQKNKGAQLNGKPIHVSKTRSLKSALLGTGFYYSRGEHLKQEMKIFHRTNEVVLGVRRPGAAALDLAQVACGRFDGFWQSRLAPWDVAAGLLLVEEAGGKISDYKGERAHIFSPEFLATNGKIHKNLMVVIRGSKKV